MRIIEQPAHVLHDMLVNKELSAKELTETFFSHIDECEDKIGAFITLMRGNAGKQASVIDAKIAGGEEIPYFAGIPVAIKDNICTKGFKTTCASKILENFVPPYDATVMTKLYEQQPIVVGKANMDEFAMGGSTEHSAYKVTRNPHDLSRVPGGSSGGSAAAVAAGEAVCALGSDTGGSIRQPSAYCGVIGLKPTYGRVSRYGLVAFASSLDQIGPITRDVTDAAYMLNVISGCDKMDSTSARETPPDFSKALVADVKGLKIGVPKEYFAEGLNGVVEEKVRAAIHSFEELGAMVKEISLPHTKYAIADYYIVAPAEAATNLERYDGVSYGARVEGKDVVEMMTNTRSRKFGAEVKRRIMIGNYCLSAGYYDAYYLKALKARTLIAADYNEAFKAVDVIMTPTTPTTAFKIGEMMGNPLQMYLQDICTVPTNLAGLPAISVPCGVDADNMPVGLQIIGRALDEETLLRTAYTYETAQGIPYVVPDFASKEG